MIGSLAKIRKKQSLRFGNNCFFFYHVLSLFEGFTADCIRFTVDINFVARVDTLENDFSTAVDCRNVEHVGFACPCERLATRSGVGGSAARKCSEGTVALNR